MVEGPTLRVLMSVEEFPCTKLDVWAEERIRGKRVVSRGGIFPCEDRNNAGQRLGTNDVLIGGNG